jgi:hypothetical protein
MSDGVKINHSQNDTILTQLVAETTTNSMSPVLPDELIEEILMKVPMRPLIRMKCVCKSWQALISNPRFAIYHLLLTGLYHED